MKIRIASCAAAVSVLAGSAMGQGIPEAYTLVELVPAAGQPDSRALAVNDINEVAGWSGLAGSFAPVFSLATVWEDPASPTDLGLSFGASSSVAIDINANGTVLMGYSGGSESRAVRTSGGSILALPDPAGDMFPTYGIRISESDDVGATFDPFDDQIDGSVVVWRRRPAGMVVDSSESLPGGLTGGAMAPNGVFTAGGSGPFSGGAEAVRFDPRDGTELELEPGGDLTTVFDASASGWVVGESDFDTTGTFGLAFATTPNGEAIPIAPFGCEDTFEPDPFFCSIIAFIEGSISWGVNEAGTVVGFQPRVEEVPLGDDDEDIVVLDDEVAFIWSEATGAIDLSTLIPDGSADGWELNEATDINNSGVVVGNGINPMGQERGFILIPRPRCAADVNADGGVDSADFFAWVNAFGNGCD